MFHRVEEGRRAEGEPVWAQDKTAEQIAAAHFPDIKPGQPSSLIKPGFRLVYRTARARAETIALATAKRRGAAQVWAGFRASTHTGFGLTGKSTAFQKKLNAAARRGQVPLFVTPYVSVAADPETYLSNKQDWDVERGHVRAVEEVQPVTYALLIPDGAVLHEASLVRDGSSQSYMHQLTFPDSEYVIDARQVLRVWRVPSGVWRPIERLVKVWAARLIVRGQFRGNFKDKDPDLASSIIDAVMDLRAPTNLKQRPFTDVPVKTHWGNLIKGGRVMLKDGTTTVLKGVQERVAHPFSSEGHDHNVRWSKPLWFAVPRLESALGLLDGVTGWSKHRLDPWWVEGALVPGATFSKAQRLATLQRNRRGIARWLKEAEQEAGAWLTRFDAEYPRSLLASIRAAQARLRELE